MVQQAAQDGKLYRPHSELSCPFLLEVCSLRSFVEQGDSSKHKGKRHEVIEDHPLHLNNLQAIPSNGSIH
jgi:hypothetical protein